MRNQVNRPAPGAVVATPFGQMTTCHLCRSFTLVWTSSGLIAPHDRPRGEGPCLNQWGAADLASAIARDEQLNDDERATHGRVYQWLTQCTGYQRLGDGSTEECNHRP